MPLTFSEPKEIFLSDIDPDPITQTRAEQDQAAIADYARAMEAGDTFPPVQLMREEAKYLILDGFHRVAAAKLAKRERILAAVTDGTIDEGQAWAYANANRTHGVRRTNKDKRRHCWWLLDRELKARGSIELSHSELGRMAAVSDKTAKSYRKEWDHRRRVAERLPAKLQRGRSYYFYLDDGEYGAGIEFGYFEDDLWIIAHCKTTGPLSQGEEFAPSIYYFNPCFLLSTSEDWRSHIPFDWPITLDVSSDEPILATLERYRQYEGRLIDHEIAEALARNSELGNGSAARNSELTNTTT